MLSSGALVAATFPPIMFWGTPMSARDTPIEVQQPIPMPGVFKERDAGTPISIRMNGRFRLSLHAHIKVDPVGAFWRPVFEANQNFELTQTDRTTDHWFNQEGVEHQVSNVFFAFKPLVTGPTELSFELVKWVPAASGSANANGPAAGDFTVIRTLTFPVTVVGADEASSVVEPAHQRYIQGTAPSLTHDLSTSSW